MTRVHKGFRGGTDRLVPPGRTVERVRPALAAMGITRLANVTGLDVIGIPVFTACRPNSRGVSVAQGKGSTVDAARASAVMESIETYHAENVELPLRLATPDEVRPRTDIDRLARTKGGRVDRLLWVEGRDLLSDGPRWVPFDCVHTDFSFGGRAAAPPVFEISTNGLASGNHRIEAVAHALSELVERDAAARWHGLSGADREATRLDLDSVGHEESRHAVGLIRGAGLRVAVHDLTSPFGIASFRCEIVEDPARVVHALPSAGGYGTHPDRGIALLRAVTEAAQSRLTFITGTRDDTDRAEYARMRDPARIARAWTAAADPGQRPFSAVPSHRNDTFDDDVELLLDRLRDGGVREAVIVDLTQQRFDIPVVRAVVPDLRTAHR